MSSDKFGVCFESFGTGPACLWALHAVNLILAGTVAAFAFYGSLRVLGMAGTRLGPDSA